VINNAGGLISITAKSVSTIWRVIKYSVIAIVGVSFKGGLAPHYKSKGGFSPPSPPGSAALAFFHVSGHLCINIIRLLQPQN